MYVCMYVCMYACKYITHLLFLLMQPLSLVGNKCFQVMDSLTRHSAIYLCVLYLLVYVCIYVCMYVYMYIWKDMHV